MTIPVALFIQKSDTGYDLIVRTLEDGVDHIVNGNGIQTVMEAYDLFDFMIEEAKENKKYDIQYISEDII